MAVDQKILSEAYPIIEKLAKSRSSNGKFAYYESSDIYQEVWGMCLEALERYDPNIGPIENYLVRHVTNRTKNLKRDHYFRPGSDASTSGLARVRMNLVNALPLNDEEDFEEKGVILVSMPSSSNPIDHLLCDETFEYIYSRLPDDLRDTFELLIGNNSVRSPMVEEVRKKVSEILNERDNDVGF